MIQQPHDRPANDVSRILVCPTVRGISLSEFLVIRLLRGTAVECSVSDKAGGWAEGDKVLMSSMY